MQDKIKSAFDEIKASAKLKEQTKAYILNEINEKNRQNVQKNTLIHFRRLALSAACLAVCILSAYMIYFIPTAQISIDINPSVELEINRFDKVLSCEGMNDDGKTLVEELDVKHLDYTEAVRKIIGTQKVTQLLSDGEHLTVLVVGDDEALTDKMLTNVRQCTEKEANTHCGKASTGEVKNAHEHGLSYGKYKAFLTLQELDPTINSEQVQGMTMREICDLIGELCNESHNPDTDGVEADTSGDGCDGSHGNHGRHDK